MRIYVYKWSIKYFWNLNHNPAGKYWSPGCPEGRHPTACWRYPLKILFVYPGDVPIRCPEMTSSRLSNLTSKECPLEVDLNVPKTFSGRDLADLQSASYGQCRVMSLISFLLFIQNLFDWPNQSTSKSMFKCIFNPVNLFLRKKNYLCERTLSQKLDWVLNMLLNVV